MPLLKKNYLAGSTDPKVWVVGFGCEISGRVMTILVDDDGNVRCNIPSLISAIRGETPTNKREPERS